MSQSLVQSVPRRPSLILCGVLTIVVVVMAYVIAMAIAAGCAALALAWFATISFGGFIAGAGASACTLTILWSLIPRRAEFTPPGPALTRESHPRLFDEIANIAHEFGEPMPDSAYLTFEVNAWVVERGGRFGFGAERVLAIGLPLLSAMTVSEMRAILAHEFAHYYGGDTAFGPFIGKARASLAHCLERLSASYGIIGLLSRWAVVALMRLVVIKIFELYWRLFLRLTLMVSRQWEYRADELASAVGGAAPLISGLRKLSSTEVEWLAFLNSEFAPALDAGVHPPFADGFAQFRQLPGIAEMSGAQSARALEEEKPDALSTHPTFKQRAARALAHVDRQLVDDDRLALSLLDDVPRLEAQLLKTTLPDLDVTRLRSIGWDRMTEEAYAPNWYAFASEYRELLSPYKVKDIPDIMSRLSAFSGGIRDPQDTLLTHEQRTGRGADLIWNAFTLALFDAGHRLSSHPGGLSYPRFDPQCSPRDMVERLRTGVMSAPQFAETVDAMGIADLPLAPAERTFERVDIAASGPQGPQPLIIRPRLRMVGKKALYGLVAFIVIALILLGYGFSPALVAILGAIIATILSLELIWLRRHAPEAIVVTLEQIGIRWRNGRQQHIPWSSILVAEHTQQKLEMQWRLVLGPDEEIVLRDTGIDAAPWASLRAAIAHCMSQCGRLVVEDEEITGMYDEVNQIPE